MGLTDKQSRFIDEYLACLNATKAAKLAGYSKRTAHSIGHENLKKPEIRDEIERRMGEKSMSANEVLHRLTAQARGDLTELMGLELNDIADHPDGHLVKKVKIRKRREPGKDVVIEHVEIELHDPQAALVHLAKIHNLFSDGVSVEVNVNQEIPEMTDEELLRIINQAGAAKNGNGNGKH